IHPLRMGAMPALLKAFFEPALRPGFAMPNPKRGLDQAVVGPQCAGGGEDGHASLRVSVVFRRAWTEELDAESRAGGHQAAPILPRGHDRGNERHEAAGLASSAQCARARGGMTGELSDPRTWHRTHLASDASSESHCPGGVSLLYGAVPVRSGSAVRLARGSSAALIASSTVSSQTNWMVLRTSSGMSSKSLRLRAGSITRAIPARAAATTFSLIPPTGKTSPLRLTSPVIAVSLRTVRSVISETSAMNMATPALGPSLGMAPAGTCTWMSVFSNRAASIPKSAARFLTMLSAACALSRITSPS